MINTLDRVYDSKVKLKIGAGRIISISEGDVSAKLKKVNFKFARSHINGGGSVNDTIFIELDKN